jgi:hypothetical protein
MGEHRFRRTIALYLTLLALGSWWGTMVFFTFFAAPALIFHFPDKQVLPVLDVLFPAFFSACLLAGAVAVAGWFALYPAAGHRAFWAWGLAAIVAGLASTVFNLYRLFPAIHRLIGELLGGSLPNCADGNRFLRLHALSYGLVIADLVLCAIAVALLLAMMRQRQGAPGAKRDAV